MTVTSQQVLEDLMRVLGDIDELVKAAEGAPANGNAAEAPRDPALNRKLAAIRAQIESLNDRIKRGVHERVEAVDNYFRENTWKTVGVAAGLAFIAGLIVGRPSRSPND